MLERIWRSATSKVGSPHTENLLARCSHCGVCVVTTGETPLHLLYHTVDRIAAKEEHLKELVAEFKDKPAKDRTNEEDMQITELRLLREDLERFLSVRYAASQLLIRTPHVRHLAHGQH